MRHRLWPTMLAFTTLMTTTFGTLPTWSQATNYTMRIPAVISAPATTTTVPVHLDSTGPNIDGWSFGLCHDPLLATLVSVTDGAASAAPCGSQPFFNATTLYPDGFTVGFIID